jgi:omega-hydroxy-beta-dihydromenaquinone-9 sulfotransferase
LRNSYLIAGIDLPGLLKLLRRNKISFHPKYLLRILFLFQSSCWSSVFGYIENKRFRKKIESSPIPKAPVFIIGHWRTGSTLLHQYLNLDPQLLTPTLFQVAEPNCFLTSYNYYRPIMKLLLRKNRPMDQVKLGMNEPQEDEYALFRLTGYSPLERIIFPTGPGYFLKDYPSFIPEGDKKLEWEKQIVFFYKKLLFENNRTLVSKNPFHSLRIAELLKLFPDARFIHIYRNPSEVIPSTLHLWKIVQKQNSLNKHGRLPEIHDLVKYLDHFWSTIRKDLELVEERNQYKMKFEELEREPLQTVKDLYSHFNISFTQEVQEMIEKFTLETREYRKNRYEISKTDIDLIKSELKNHLEYFKYT